MVVLMQTDFQEVRMELESTLQAVVILTKGGGGYYVIGLVVIVGVQSGAASSPHLMPLLI